MTRFWDRVKPAREDETLKEKVSEIKKKKRTKHGKKAIQKRWGKK